MKSTLTLAPILLPVALACKGTLDSIRVTIPGPPSNNTLELLWHRPTPTQCGSSGDDCYCFNLDRDTLFFVNTTIYPPANPDFDEKPMFEFANFDYKVLYPNGTEPGSNADELKWHLSALEIDDSTVTVLKVEVLDEGEAFQMAFNASQLACSAENNGTVCAWNYSRIPEE